MRLELRSQLLCDADYNLLAIAKFLVYIYSSYQCMS